MRHLPRAAGYSLLELLLLLSIFVVGAGLAIPTVARFREASYRARCANNLRQIGQACNAFENTFGYFPSSIKELGPQRSWALQILPWIGQEALAQRYNYEKPWYAEENNAAISQPIPLFLCPASPYGPRTVSGIANIKTTSPSGDRQVKRVPFHDAACTDYAVIHQVRKEAFLHGFVDKAGPGLMAEDLFPRRSDVPDGLEYTIMVIENGGRPDEWMGRRLTRYSIKPADGPFASRDNDFSLRGSQWDPDTQTYSNTNCGPCAINCLNVEGIYSFHHGGAQAVFGDGSVRFLGQTLTTRQVARLVTRAGGETVSWDDY